jgi:hypothetical protein
MLQLVKWERIMQLALRLVLQVKQWQLYMFQLILSALRIMPYRLSIEPPIPLIVILP